MKLIQLHVERTFVLGLTEGELNELIKYIPIEEESTGKIIGNIRRDLRHLRITRGEDSKPISIGNIIIKG